MASRKKEIKSANIPASFAGANTGAGFVSLYEPTFSESGLAGLYIIKGGSGTGKSSYMRKLGKTAVSMGYSVEHYLCGSDEKSLDGIIIKGKNGTAVGVIDGTPPHPREFTSPGAAGDMLNFGEFWNSKALRERRAEIDGLCREKSVAFETAYRYLGAADRINRHVCSMISGIYLKDKGAAAAARLVSSIGSAGTPVYRQLMGYTMNGMIRLAPAEGELRSFAICGDEDVGRRFLADAADVVRKRGISAQISSFSLNLTQPDGIYFPSENVWFHLYEEGEPEPERRINVRRFIDKEEAAANRQKLRFGKKCRKSLIDGAVESLGEAKRRHFELEKIYSAQMDFPSLDEKAELWTKEILSRIK